MPTYTFDCTACGVSQEHVMSIARYTDLLRGVPFSPPGYRFPEVECSSCERPDVLTRDPASDYGDSYTERSMEWGDTTPLEGLGGFSRERQKILDKHGLRQKDGAKRKPRKRRNYDPSRMKVG